MTHSLNETHEPARVSWVESANDGKTDFPIQNLPYGVFRRRASPEPPRIGVAIGGGILDLAACAKGGFLDGLPPGVLEACRQPELNALMAQGQEHWAVLRLRVSRLLCSTTSADVNVLERCLVSMTEAEMCLPATIGNYTDFYASIDHARNVGAMFRPDTPLLPNYRFVPIAYHGRASSLVVSGSPVRRPCGQTRAEGRAEPEFGPSRALDYELELGFFIGPGNRLGERLSVGEARDRLFGVCLVNDWSARDIQKWEYQPLGPFLGKSFGTSVSPWVVTAEALAPYRIPAAARPAGDPPPLPYLLNAEEQQRGGLAITLEVWLSSKRMRGSRQPAVRVSQTSAAGLYWTPGQLIAHHASNGCNLCPGDLLATGTVSGPAKENRGCLLELTRQGDEPLTLPNGEIRRFLEDGDEVCLQGFCEAAGRPRLGLGECRGTVAPSN